MSGLIVLVDGFNLYHGLKEKFDRRLLWLDLTELAKRLRPHSVLLGVKYFTAPVLDDPAAASNQARYQRALEVQSGGVLEIVQGRYQKKTLTCRKCGGSWVHYEEKETDVNIATSMVVAGADGAADSILVISADSDLVPAIKAVRAINPGVFVAAAFPPARYSAELRKIMPASFHIGTSKIVQSQLPDVVLDEAGRELRRPAKWR